MPQFLILSGPLYKYRLETIVDILNIHLSLVIDKDITISSPETSLLERLVVADMAIPPFRFYRGTLLHNKKRIHIPSIRLKILFLLAETPNSLVSYETIRRLVWPANELGVDFSSLKKHISLIRRDLKDYIDTSSFIITVNSIGYILVPEKEETVLNGARDEDSLSELSPVQLENKT